MTLLLTWSIICLVVFVVSIVISLACLHNDRIITGFVFGIISTITGNVCWILFVAWIIMFIIKTVLAGADG